MASIDEQETTVSQPRAGLIHIYSTVPAHLRRLRSEERAREISGGEDYGTFEVAESDYDALTGFRKRMRPMTDEQRKAAGERLKRAREARNA